MKFFRSKTSKIFLFKFSLKMMIFQILSCLVCSCFSHRQNHLNHRMATVPIMDGNTVDILIDSDILPLEVDSLHHQKRDFDFGNIFDLNKEATVCEAAFGPQIGFTCDVCETLASKSNEVRRKMRRKRSQRMKKLHQNVKKHCINILPCCIKLRLYNIIA